MRGKAVQAWPLWAVLAAQAALTLPWLWRTAPFTDEALYLEAGHRVWAHWLHHTTLPAYPAWFSGAPVLYPPLGAAADAAGGLVAARGLSLALMAGCTCLVYLTAGRLAGRHAAFFAAALFAFSGLTVHYGAFATFDPLALFFLALSLWAGVRAADGKLPWILPCAVSLALANAAKYATLPFDLVIIGVIFLRAWAANERVAAAAGKGLLLAASVAGLDTGLLALGGPQYARGVAVTTVFRTIHWAPPSSAANVLWRAFALTGAVVLPGALGVVVSLVRRNPLPVTGLLLLLVLAAVIVPAGQARIHQISSLDKNLGFGLPFAALAASYAISAGTKWAAEHLASGQLAGNAAGAVLVLITLTAGRLQVVQFQGPSMHAASRIVAAIRGAYRPGTLVLSSSDTRMEQYYLPEIPASSWKLLRRPAAQLPGLLGQRCARSISVVILSAPNPRTHPQSSPAARLLRATRFRPAVTVGQGSQAIQVWRHTDPAQNGSCP
jgi:4-amino-4-deoxy-L-arabinose transferase-like glycosyltransferase